MRALISFIIVFVITGCAVHSPMSEMLMFQQKEDYEGRKYRSRYSHSLLTFTANLYPADAVNSYTEGIDPTGEDSRYDYRTATSLMTNAIFMSDRSDNIAVSLGIGNDVGIDATIKLINDMYLSGSADIFSEQGQIIIQKRLFDGTPAGMSLGVTYQRIYQYVPIDGKFGCGFCFPSEEFFSNSIGIRTVGILAPPSRYGKSAFFLYATGSINYDLTIRTLYPKVGFSIGFY